MLGLIGELGYDFLDKFPTAGKFCKWCNLTPNNKVSGGKLLSSRITKKKNEVGQIFRNAAMSMANDKGEVGIYYRRIRSRHGGIQANVATAHKLAKIFYTMIANKTEYDATKVGISCKDALARKIMRAERNFMKLKNQYESA